jgi:hypothetical protein
LRQGDDYAVDTEHNQAYIFHMPDWGKIAQLNIELAVVNTESSSLKLKQLRKKGNLSWWDAWKLKRLEQKEQRLKAELEEAEK